MAIAVQRASACAPGNPVPGVTEGRSRPGTVAPSLGTLRAVVLLVHAADAPPDERTAAPEATLASAARWYRAVSYGRLDLRTETLARWLPLPARSTEYASDPARYLRDAVAAGDPYVDFSAFDVVYLAPSSRTPETRTSALLTGFGVRADGRDVQLWVPFGAGFATEHTAAPYVLLHETGHLLGLPDLYSASVPSTFHRWDVMAARWPAELLAWHRWKLGWLEPTQIVCVSGRARKTVTITPIERAGGTKAAFVRLGPLIYAVEARSRLGYDRTACDTGILVYSVDQTPFRRAPVRIYSAGSDRFPPRRGCTAKWNAPFDLGRGETRVLVLSGLRVEVLARRPDGAYRVRITT